jgi:hypothetical protein
MAAYVGHYISLKAIERRLSAAVVRRVYDDQNIGVVEDTDDEDNPMVQLIRDAEAKFEGYCRGNYDLTSLRNVHPPEAVRICLDCAEALAAKRFPRAVNRDWVALEQSVNDELKKLRTGQTRFDVIGPPEPAANQGGYTSSGDPDAPQPVREMTFNGNWGNF